jgi:hypothetical protein
MSLTPALLASIALWQGIAGSILVQDQGAEKTRFRPKPV